MTHTLDLQFLGVPGTIACYLIPHANGGILIESGPGSTIPALQTGLGAHGMKVTDITDVFLTHIHLDHAGAAGWLARQGARIHVHPNGAPHLLDPSKLLSSAARIYGDQMEELWGQFLAVPEQRLLVVQDGDIVEINGVCIRAVDTPGHAYHHFAYLIDGTCFSGDIGGVRLCNLPHIRLPMPPPEFNLEVWRESLAKLQAEFNRGAFQSIAPTHFGIYDDVPQHLAILQRALDEVDGWMSIVMPANPPIERLNEQFLEWSRQRSQEQGLSQAELEAFETANPSWMSPYGIQRYWRKFRSGLSPS